MADGAPYPGKVNAPLVDGFGRAIRTLRVSVTDRCDFRCVYCMAEKVTFVPKADVLRLEEIECLCRAFVGLGVRRIRLTGGEPLIRPGFMGLVESLGTLVTVGALDELTLTTNGNRLVEQAAALAAAGVRRINVSLDTLQPDRFRALTRYGDIDRVIAGIDAARACGLAVKINCVALRGVNDDEFDTLIGWCGARGCDLTLIEVMPLGASERALASDSYLSLEQVRQRLEKTWTLEPVELRTSGPARYFRIGETGGRLGIITPISQSFCDQCNRVRLTATGRLYLCLGQEHAVDLRAVLRAADGAEPSLLQGALRRAVAAKPERHGFLSGSNGASQPLARPMNTTGG